MSLLLDALKRAEEAKKAQRQAESQAAEAGSEPLSLAPLEGEEPGAKEPQQDANVDRPLTTRNDLPNISQALEILPEDLAPATSGNVGQRAQRVEPRKQENEEAFRDAARQLFEAKTPAYNPRKPFYITLGALGVCAIGIVIYFWYQLQPARPAPAIASVTRTLAADEAPREIAQGSPALKPPAQPGRTAPISFLPETPQPLPSEPRTDIEAPNLRPIDPVSDAPTRPDTPRNEKPVLQRVDLKISAPSGPSLAEQGYAAYERGDFAAARTHYRAALEKDPLNRDALLGLAALDVREQQYVSAQAHYLRLLEIDPRDPYAHAGLLSLRGQQDPVAAESRIKNLIAQRPDANVLHFTLGNQYAAQERWPEAQQAYFKAYTSDPMNPDYAFNLAVSLDHLRQPQLALEYYQKALKLAAERPAAFVTAQAENRIVELSR